MDYFRQERAMKSCSMTIVGGLLLLPGLNGLAAEASPQLPAKDVPARLNADFKSLLSALKTYQLNAGNFPTTEQGLQALVEKPVIAPIPRRWAMLASKLPLDPWGSTYRYRFPGSVDPKEPEILSSGPDGVAGNLDDLSSQKK